MSETRPAVPADASTVLPAVPEPGMDWAASGQHTGAGFVQLGHKAVHGVEAGPDTASERLVGAFSEQFGQGARAGGGMACLVQFLPVWRKHELADPDAGLDAARARRRGRPPATRPVCCRSSSSNAACLLTPGRRLAGLQQGK